MFREVLWYSCRERSKNRVLSQKYSLNDPFIVGDTLIIQRLVVVSRWSTIDVSPTPVAPRLHSPFLSSLQSLHGRGVLVDFVDSLPGDELTKEPVNKAILATL